MKTARLFHEPRRRGPGRPRRSATGHAILKATRDILAQGGVHGLTVEGVAERSGIAKTTIYRRARAKEDLARAALLEVIREEPPVRHAGSTKVALNVYLGQLVKNVNSKLYGRILRGLISEMAVDPELARGFREQVLARRIGVIRDVLRRGIERRELRSDLDV